jgi:AbrB family looped-hinge helix DNA binding protein
MNEFRVKIGTDGRILIPVICRRQLKLHAGEELVIKLDKEELHLFSLKQSLKKAQELVRAHTKKRSLVQKLRQHRQEDFSRE